MSELELGAGSLYADGVYLGETKGGKVFQAGADWGFRSDITSLVTLRPRNQQFQTEYTQSVPPKDEEWDWEKMRHIQLNVEHATIKLTDAWLESIERETYRKALLSQDPTAVEIEELETRDASGIEIEET